MLENNQNFNEAQKIMQNQNNNKQRITNQSLDQIQNAQTKNMPHLSKMNLDDNKENKIDVDSAEKKTRENSNINIAAIEVFKNKKETYQKKHQEKLNEILISNYGTEIYDTSVELEDKNFFPFPLKNHKIDNDIRTKMIDWMLEVLSAYNSEIFTFNLSVQIMDMYIAKCKTCLSNNEVHLIGIVAMFIASKMEDIYPIRMSHVRTKISHGKFTEKDIRKKEKMVLEALNFDVITTSCSDFIKTFIYDFIHNNRKQIDSLEMWHHIDAFENVTIFLAKLIHHNVEFNQYK